ncbi:adenosine receptor A3-like [Xenia sp. Carnegie-2017]|uniref:adenosine receptor A3-like n=1 Tax=Xenia sp. Carnegie-2017 TaxID=2897299 RepID=UPI001F045C03|nr:adenosine receptor A3-like [Xenia sp. Carnegie-2017]
MPETFLSSNVAKFLSLLMATQCFVGCIANAIVLLYSIRNKRHFQNTADKLILHLAVTDFIALSTYVPWRSYLLMIRTRTTDYKFYTSLFVFCIFLTGSAVLLIAFDRFVALTRPLRYKGLITSKVFWISVKTSWICAFLLGIFHYFSYDFRVHGEYEVFLSSLSFLQLILMAVIYTFLLKSIANLGRKMCGESVSFNIKQSALTVKTVRMTFVIVCLFYATFTPYTVYRIVSTADESMSNHEKNGTWRWLIAFTFLNSCINPFVYFYRMKKYRHRLCISCFGMHHDHGERNHENLQNNITHLVVEANVGNERLLASR